jgi:hypothetical protein
LGLHSESDVFITLAVGWDKVTIVEQSIVFRLVSLRLSLRGAKATRQSLDASAAGRGLPRRFAPSNDRRKRLDGFVCAFPVWVAYPFSVQVVRPFLDRMKTLKKLL